MYHAKTFFLDNDGVPVVVGKKGGIQNLSDNFAPVRTLSILRPSTKFGVRYLIKSVLIKTYINCYCFVNNYHFSVLVIKISNR